MNASLTCSFERDAVDNPDESHSQRSRKRKSSLPIDSRTVRARHAHPLMNANDANNLDDEDLRDRDESGQDVEEFVYIQPGPELVAAQVKNVVDILPKYIHDLQREVQRLRDKAERAEKAAERAKREKDELEQTFRRQIEEVQLQAREQVDDLKTQFHEQALKAQDLQHFMNEIYSNPGWARVRASEDRKTVWPQ